MPQTALAEASPVPPAVTSAELAAPTVHLTPPGSNYYPYGQCTYYVATRRAIPARWGNASSWYYAARRSGWLVGSQPAVGAIAWTPAGWTGHVAYVELVEPGRVLISEMNYAGGWGRVHQRWVRPSEFSYIY